MAVKTYRKTALVTAEQFLPAIGQIPAGVQSSALGDPSKRTDAEWVLDTKEGRHTLRGGDYICTGPAGEQWNVAAEIFEATYEEVPEREWFPFTSAPRTGISFDVLTSDGHTVRNVHFDGSDFVASPSDYRSGSFVSWSTAPCGIADPSTRDCQNMKEVGGGMDGERYRCDVCGKSYFLDYDEMK